MNRRRRAFVIIGDAMLPTRVVWVQPTSGSFVPVPCDPSPQPPALAEAQGRVLALEDAVEGLHKKLKLEADRRLENEALIATLRRRNRILRNEERD